MMAMMRAKSATPSTSAAAMIMLTPIGPTASGWRAIASTALPPMRPMPMPQPMTAMPAPMAPPSLRAPSVVRPVPTAGAAPARPAVSSAWAGTTDASISTKPAAINISANLAALLVIANSPFLLCLAAAQGRRRVGRRSVGRRFPVRVVMVEDGRLADEQRRQEGEDERLQEGDEELEQRDADAGRDHRHRHSHAADRVLAADRQDEREQHGEDHVAGEHVGEETDGKGDRLGEQAEDLDRHQDGREPERPRAEMLDELRAAQPHAVDHDHAEGQQRHRTGDPDVAGGGASQVDAE